MAFDIDTLLATARAATGLDDFGDPTFRDGLERLVEALERESVLNDVGQMAIRAQLTGYLIARLQIEDWYRRHPEIDAQTIRAPLFITGLPRTGTTAVSNLLAADPDTRSLRFWESQQPIPPPEAATYGTDARIAAADATLEGMKAAAPELAQMHDDTGSSPTENQDLLGQHFRTMHFDGMARVPSYVHWWMHCSMDSAYAHHQRVLKLLQWHCPPTRWNLKSPPDLAHLDALVRIYPDVRIIWTHRDPAKVLPSVCKLIAALRTMFSTRVDLHQLGREQLTLWSTAMNRALDWRRRVGDAQFTDVFMRDVVARPLDVMAAVYARFDLPFSGMATERMRTWLTANPQHKHGVPQYSLADFGLPLDEVRAAFRDYTQRFDVPLEI